MQLRAELSCSACISFGIVRTTFAAHQLLMKRFICVGFVLVLLNVSTGRAQSPRADISWLAGGHLSPVSSAAYSPDGTLLASSGYFGDTLKLWRASDGTMIRTFANTKAPNQFIFGPMKPVTFLPDSKTIIAIGEGATIGVWNVADGKLLRLINVSGSDLALSKDGTLIAVAAGGMIKLVRFSDGVVVRSIPWPSDLVQAVAFSPDGNVVVGGDRVGMLRTFRVADGASLLTITAHGSTVSAVRYSPDGSRIATASADAMIKLWNSTNGDPAGTLVGHTDFVTSLAFTANGLLLASGSFDHTARVWTTSTGNLVETLNQPTDVNSVNFNPATGKLAVVCDNDLREWDVPSQTLVRSLTRAGNQISGTAFTPDSTKMVSCSYDGKVSVHDVASGALLRQMVPGGNAFTVATSADTVAVGINVPNVVNLYRLGDGAFLRTITPTGSMPYSYSAAFSPDGATLATGHFNNTVQLWNVADGSSIRVLNGVSGAINSVAYTPNGAFIVAASAGGHVHIWTAAGAPVRTLGPVGQELNAVAISADNQFVLAGGQSGLLQLWQMDTGALVYGFSSGGRVSQVRFVPSGFAFYAARTEGSLNSNGTVRVYRASDHALLETYTLETGGFGNNPTGPLTVDVSPDGKRLTYGRDDATVVMAYNTLIAAPLSATLFMGQLVTGTFQNLVLADGASLVARPGQNGDRQSAPVQLDITGHSPLLSPTRLSFQMVSSANVSGLQQEIWMLNAQTGTFEQLDTRPATTTEQTVRIELGPNFARFIDPSGNFVARTKWFSVSPNNSRSWQISVDQAVWSAGL